jgi:hypothetical protein
MLLTILFRRTKRTRTLAAVVEEEEWGTFALADSNPIRTVAAILLQLLST